MTPNTRTRARTPHARTRTRIRTTPQVSVIEETVADMKRHEGLNDDKQQLFYGYVANGKPKKRLLKLMGTLNTMRTARDGIGAVSEEDQMNERDLLADM